MHVWTQSRPSWLMGMGIPGTLDILGRPVDTQRMHAAVGKVEMNPVSLCVLFPKRDYVVLCLYLRVPKIMLEWICLYLLLYAEYGVIAWI